MKNIDWEEIFNGLSVITLIIAVMIFLTQVVSCTVEYERLSKTQQCIEALSGDSLEESHTIAFSCQEAFSQKN